MKVSLSEIPSVFKRFHISDTFRPDCFSLDLFASLLKVLHQNLTDLLKIYFWKLGAMDVKISTVFVIPTPIGVGVPKNLG